MINLIIRQVEKGYMVKIQEDKSLHTHSYLCDWIRDTGERLELIRYARNPEGNFRLDSAGNKIETRLNTILKSYISSIEGERYLTKV